MSKYRICQTESDSFALQKRYFFCWFFINWYDTYEDAMSYMQECLKHDLANAKAKKVKRIMTVSEEHINEQPK